MNSMQTTLAAGVLLLSCQATIPAQDLYADMATGEVLMAQKSSQPETKKANSEEYDNGVEASAEDGKYPPAKVHLETRSHDQYGKYLTDTGGRTLYMFARDAKNTSTCYAACARAWPPVLTYGHPVTVADSLKKEKVGEIRRLNDTTQVSYNGHALYYYYPDAKEGDVTGQGVVDHGAEWYLLNPKGQRIHSHAKSSH